MLSKQRFVFYDGKGYRWKTIKKILVGFFVVADILSLSLLSAVYYSPRFGAGIYRTYSQKPKDIIENISTRKKETIEVEGEGPLLELKRDKDTYTLVRSKFEEDKTVILTFDDGPDPTFTPKILDILQQGQVKAMFFVVGKQLVKYPHLAKRIVEEGHQIGVHTFSHFPEELDLYSDQGRMGFELDFSQKLIMAQTGFKTNLFRVPFWGTEDTTSLNTLVFATHAIDRNYTIVSLTIDSFDWKEKNHEKVIDNSVNLASSQIILMHDGGGDRKTTVNALPEIIRRYKDAGFSFETIDFLLGPDTKAMTPASFIEKVISYVSVFAYWLKINFSKMAEKVFKVSLGVLGTGILGTVSLSFCQLLFSLKKRKINFSPFVSVLIPAYNEQETIGRTLKSLLGSTYPKFEVIVINNNSIDKTERIVKKFLSDSRVKIINEKIQGKFAALNRGIAHASGEILLIVDADTQVLENTMLKIVKYFADAKVGAVAGNLNVGNSANTLCAFQTIEYIVGLNLGRRAYDMLGTIPVVPGALGAWRKKAIIKAGGYRNDTLTEDADLTIRIQKMGYRATFAGDSIGYTEAPESFEAFLRQRLRWTLGILQVFYKHRKILFRKKYGALGIVVFPYLTVIQLPLMVVSPLVDLLALVFLLYFPTQIVTYFLIFLLINFALTVIAFIISREKRIWLLFFLPLSRIIYQFIWYYVLYKSLLVALKGIYVPWKKLDHLGRFLIQGKKASALFAYNDKLG